MKLIKHLTTYNWEGAIRGMRNPLGSHRLSDSYTHAIDGFTLGPADLELALKLIKLGGAHRKFLRQIGISFDITANLKFFDQLSTYEHLVSNSTSQMHTLLKRPFTIDDFSNELTTNLAKQTRLVTVNVLNHLRKMYLSKDLPHGVTKKDIWRDIVELVPQSILYTRTITINYEVFLAMYRWRHTHKMKEWEILCLYLRANLPYADVFLSALSPVINKTKAQTTSTKLIKELVHGAVWDLSSLSYTEPCKGD